MMLKGNVCGMVAMGKGEIFLGACGKEMCVGW